MATVNLNIAMTGLFYAYLIVNYIYSIQLKAMTNASIYTIGCINGATEVFSKCSI